MSDGKKANDVAQFQDITSCSEERARFYLESADYNLDTALANFFYDDEQHDANDSDDVEEIPDQRTSKLDQSPGLARSFPKVPSKSQQVKGSTPKSSGNVKTLSSYQNPKKDSDSSDEEGQAFYAGGSEHSGQQVLGPPRRRNQSDIVSDVFQSVREFGAEVVNSQSKLPSGRPRFGIFGGSGFRLGETASDAQAMSQRRSTDESSSTEITLNFWRNGFSINEGPLRAYDDPKSKDFLHHIKHGEIPPELVMQAQPGHPGRDIGFNIVDNRQIDYPTAAPKVVSFSGTGQKLGSVTPTLSSPIQASDPESKTEDVQPNPIQTDLSRPTTNVQIRLADGSRLIGTFNHDHTIGDLRAYINASSSQSRSRNYTLSSTFPRKELANDEDTIEKSGILNSVVMQNFIS